MMELKLYYLLLKPERKKKWKLMQPETEQSKSMTLLRNTSFCNTGVHGEHFIWILYKI